MEKMEEKEMRKEKEEKKEKEEGWLSYIAKEFIQLKTETEKELTQVANMYKIHKFFMNLVDNHWSRC